MRVRHLNEIEIQALLDRRAMGTAADVAVEVYRKDLDSQEHLDNCPICRSEMEVYRGLYQELGRCRVPHLPRSFARKVTFSLPPFRAKRTRTRLQLAAIWGTSLLVSLFWLLAQINIGLVVARSVAAVSGFLHQSEATLSLLVAVLRLFFDPASIWFLGQLSGVAGAVERALTAQVGPANMILVAGLVLLMIASVDKLYSSTLRQRS